MRNLHTISSNYFAPQDVPIAEDDILLIACMRNEGLRLPYFLDYYRRLGVDRFLLIDNNSTDDTADYLRAQPDVSYFRTTASYRGSSAGRIWMQEIADTYGTDHWILTVDVDELLTFPAAEELNLHDLCAYLENYGHGGLFTVMLDMYSDRPLSQTVYEKGTDFLDTCPFFETDTYSLAPGMNPPFLSVFGGPRGRLFEDEGGRGRGPMMKKIPLVKWRPGFSYMFSTHSHRFVQLSDVTGALLHFKFFDTFEHLAVEEARRGDRRQRSDYDAYRAHSAGGDLCFYGSHSYRLRSPRDLVQLGVMSWSSRFAAFSKHTTRQRGVPLPDGYDLLPAAPSPEGKLTLRSVSALWPFVQNPGIARHFGLEELPTHVDRSGSLNDMRRHVKVIDVKGDHLLVRVHEDAQHRWHSNGLGIAVFVGRQIVSTARLDGSDPNVFVDVESLEPGMCRVDVPIRERAVDHGWQGDEPVPVTAYLFDAGEATPGRQPRPPSATEIRTKGALVASLSWFPDTLLAKPILGYDGVIDRLEDGSLRGWVYDFEDGSFDVPITVYVNGRLVSHAMPARRRADLDGIAGNRSVRGKGFVIPIPMGYFADSGVSVAEIEAFVAGTNIQLRRSPLVVSVHSTTARWDGTGKEWIVDGIDALLERATS